MDVYCPDCGEDRVSEFGVNRRRKNGLQAKCKRCTRAQLNASRAKNRERRNSTARAWQAKNRDKAHAANRRWEEAHKDERREYHRKRNQDPKVRARRRELARLRRLADPEKYRARQAKQRERNREKIRIQAREQYKPHPIPGLIARIDARVERSQDGHWRWTGSRIRNLPMVQHERKQLSARRVLYEHVVGPVDADLEVAAVCGYRPCMRPSHLAVMTRTERRTLDANPFVKEPPAA